MRQISAQMHDRDSLPTNEEAPQLWSSEEERLRAGDRLLALMHKGYDLGGLRILDRDELYERD